MMTKRVTIQGSLAARPPSRACRRCRSARRGSRGGGRGRRRREIPIEDLVDAAVEAGDGEGEDAEGDEGEVAEGGVGGELA